MQYDFDILIHEGNTQDTKYGKNTIRYLIGRIF